MIRAGVGLAFACSILSSALAVHVIGSRAQDVAGAVPMPFEREVYLMGTRARLVTHEASRAAGLAALDAALKALEATEAELTTWRGHSAISELNRSPIGTPWIAPATLCAMFDEVYRWRDVTAGAFDPAIGALSAAWGIHEAGRIPSADEIETALKRSGLDRLAFDRGACTITRTVDVTLDVGAFGKGEALDRAAAMLGPSSWMIDLGGQVSVGGPQPDGRPWTIDIAHPRARDRPLLQVHMRYGSLSTSGGSERDQIVNGQHVGHILDPRIGRPAPFRGSAIVWHERGLVADILSTALFVMGADEGTAWAEARGLSAVFLIPDRARVRVRATRAFESRLVIHKVD